MSDYFWKSPPMYNHPALTEQMIVDAEAVLGVKLPKTYLDLLKSHNGGYIHYNAFSTPDLPPTIYDGNGYIPVTSLNGIGVGNSLDILETPYFLKEWEMPAGLVLLDGDGHTWIALDYRQVEPQGEPSIVWIDNELDEEIQVAPNFEAFLKGLLELNKDKLD